MGPPLILLFFVVYVSSTDVKSRLDCYPEPFATQQSCAARGCIWEQAFSSAPVGTPWCFFPSSTGYSVSTDDGPTHKVLQKTSAAPNPYGTDISPLDFRVNAIGGTIEISIGTAGRYVPPVNFPKAASANTDPLQVQYATGPGNTFAFKVVRQQSGVAVWDTTIGGLLFADKFIQIASYLPSTSIFGLGDHVHKTLKHNMTRYTTWPMLARDIGPDSKSDLSTQNLYGVHPFYLCIENDGRAHGVMILNSNPQEFTLGPAPHLVYRTTGGQLDIAFFPGPTPELVIQGYHAYIGKSFLPAYWALGFQLCRWGYKNLTDMQNIVARNRNAGVPLDIVYADIDYMSHYEDFTEGDNWLGFGNYTRQLHTEGVRLILIFDPAVEVDYSSFQRGIEQNASFIEWPRFDLVPRSIQDKYPMAKNTKIMLGNVWPDRNTAFPDFLDTTDKTTAWWVGEFGRFHNITAFDGIWIDMNEPSNFDTDVHSDPRTLSDAAHLSCPISGTDGALDNPPYPTHAVFDRPGEHLSSKTLCMLGKTMRGTNDFFNTKNLYGWSEARATAQALAASTGKRGAVISRSTFPSSGRYGGHWLGDNTARWEDLQTSVIGAMEFNFFGLPYVGSDICGFNGASNEELCLRWMQMGAFHSFSRNHNVEGAPPQDPAQWPSVAAAARTALLFRYQYLPYLYTLHYQSSLNGGTVVRPLFFEFPQDFETYEIDRQFLWGKSMMIAPALEQGMTSVRAYFPADRWYSLSPLTYGQQIPVGFNMVPAPTTSLTPVFVRGGVILPRQTPANTTDDCRKNPFELLITMAATKYQPSFGEMYYDDGDSTYGVIAQNKHIHLKYTFNYNDTTAVLYIQTMETFSYNFPSLDIIDVLGYLYYPDFTTFTFNGAKVNVNTQKSSYNAFKKTLLISTPGLFSMNTIAASSTNTITWGHKLASLKQKTNDLY